jgi:hypothetical protein
MIGIGTPSSQSRIPRPINHPAVFRSAENYASTMGPYVRSRMHQRVGGCLLGVGT